MLLRRAEAGLSADAQELSHNADSLSDEINSVFLKMNAPTPSACSNRDLAELRAQTFRSFFIKDIGRTQIWFRVVS
jgi:hypothetical protein